LTREETIEIIPVKGLVQWLVEGVCVNAYEDHRYMRECIAVLCISEI
jgi:hypothetical protein